MGHAADALSPGEFRPTGKVVAVMESTLPSTLIGAIEISADARTTRLVPQDILLPKFLISIPPAQMAQIRQYSAQELKSQIFEATSEPWKAGQFLPRCNFKSHLGKSVELSTALKIIQASNNLPSDEFPRSVQHQARDLSRWQASAQDLQQRTDCRALRVFSIDPETAKDLDDAMSIVVRPDGHLEVGVHIADVSHFLTPGSPMDLEAQRRATTFYLPWKNIPMLPRVLSDNLCSLLPGQERLAFSVFWVFTPDAQIVQCHFAKTLIQSRCKLTYGIAQQLLNAPSDQPLPQFPQLNLDDATLQGITEDLRLFDALAKRLRAMRFENGSLLLNSPKIVFDLEPETHAPLSYHMYEYKDTNSMVEEFMLLANTSVATSIFSAFPDLAVVRRHPAPKKDRLHEFEATAEKLGATVDASTSLTLNQSLEKLRQESAEEVASGVQRGPKYFLSLICHLLGRKPMELAQYVRTSSSLAFEHYHHYALHFPLYTHFTSPIRRYADVLVHRLLTASLTHSNIPDPEELQRCILACNAQNKMSDRAEDDAQRIMLQQLILHRGPIYEDGLVTAINANRRSLEISLLRIDSIRGSINLADYSDLFTNVAADEAEEALNATWAPNVPVSPTPEEDPTAINPSGVQPLVPKPGEPISFQFGTIVPVQLRVDTTGFRIQTQLSLYLPNHHIIIPVSNDQNQEDESSSSSSDSDHEE